MDQNKPDKSEPLTHIRRVAQTTTLRHYFPSAASFSPVRGEREGPRFKAIHPTAVEPFH